MPARQHRITRGDEYRRVVRSGYRVGGAYCMSYAIARPVEAPARFGFIVSQAVGSAVVRNKIRRRLKTVSERKILEGWTGCDVVFRVLPAASGASFLQLEREITQALSRIERKMSSEARVS